MASYLFRHKRIRRFSVGIKKFEFKDFRLRLNSDEDREEFLKIVEQLPTRESVDIVEINEEAAAVAERSVVSKQGVVRGTFNAGDILTSKDKQAIQSQLAGGSAPNANALAPKPGAPIGFNPSLLNK